MEQEKINSQNIGFSFSFWTPPWRNTKKESATKHSTCPLIRTWSCCHDLPVAICWGNFMWHGVHCWLFKGEPSCQACAQILHYSNSGPLDSDANTWPRWCEFTCTVLLVAKGLWHMWHCPTWTLAHVQCSVKKVWVQKVHHLDRNCVLNCLCTECSRVHGLVKIPTICGLKLTPDGMSNVGEIKKLETYVQWPNLSKCNSFWLLQLLSLIRTTNWDISVIMLWNTFDISGQNLWSSMICTHENTATSKSTIALKLRMHITPSKIPFNSKSNVQGQHNFMR